MRIRLPDRRPSQTVKMTWGTIDAYVVVGFYENDQPGEVFITIAKQGSAISEMAGQVAVMTSLLLQTGTTAAKIVAKWENLADGSIFRLFAEALKKAVSLQGGQLDLDYQKNRVENE